jgi:hypothetical protein
LLYPVAYGMQNLADIVTYVLADLSAVYKYALHRLQGFESIDLLL